jgi:hypothetical protein
MNRPVPARKKGTGVLRDSMVMDNGEIGANPKLKRRPEAGPEVTLSDDFGWKMPQKETHCRTGKVRRQPSAGTWIVADTALGRPWSYFRRERPHRPDSPKAPGYDCIR